MSEEKPQNHLPAGGTPNLNQLEEEILKYWEENKIFEKSLEQTKDKEPFIFYDGPPFATGLPHYGSILPSVIKDCIPRFQTMKGRYVRRRWGWDCHGLPIENLVEKNLKISGKKQIEELGVEKFNQACRDNVLNFTREWGKMVRRMARWVEFDNAYKTMDSNYMESVWWGLKQAWNKGLIYEDRKVLLYCSRCETPISNFEVAMDNSYKDITEESVFVKFKLVPRQRFTDNLTDHRTYALAWTTTPWTLPGNTSLNVGKNIRYVLVEQNGERYVLAKERLGVLLGEYELISEFSGASLEGLVYEPLYKNVIANPTGTAHKVYLADFVTTTDGTGIVHNAAMYGEEDYELAKEKNLPRVDMLSSKGEYLEMAPEHLRGVFFKDADKVVIANLNHSQQLYKLESYTHAYPHCYRCATPLFYNALPAWFIDIQKIKSELVVNNQNINWYPEHLKFGRFQMGIQNAPDWNISRNRFWATPLPFWKCQDCGEKICIGSVKELRAVATNFGEVYPAAELKLKNFEAMSEIPNSQFSIPDADLDLHKPYIDKIKLKCEKCQGAMLRVPEVVDCWVESGSMPFAELHAPFENEELFKSRFPSDFVVEYIPQTRAWFYVMHVVSTILFNQAPFRNVLTTGTILGEDGTKMSKSKGNYPDPNLIIDKYGADALRFYLLTSPVVLGEDVNFSEKGVNDVNRKIILIFYNVWSFYRMYEKEQISTTAEQQISQSANILDKWILSRLFLTHKRVTEYMEKYNTVKAGKEIAEFVEVLSVWYLRRSRDRIKSGGEAAKAALATLHYVLAETCKLLAPFMPFISEYIYRDLTGKASVHLETWSISNLAIDEKLLEHMVWVREIVSLGLAVRKEKSLPVRQPLSRMAYVLAKANIELENDLQEIILAELNIKTVDTGFLLSQTDVSSLGSVSGVGNGVLKVCLDMTLTPELKQEGVARELERLVQDLRKKSGLKVGELADVYYNTLDPQVEEALINLFDRKKTFVVQITKSLEVEVDFEVQGLVGGKPVWLGIIKA